MVLKHKGKSLSKIYYFINHQNSLFSDTEIFHLKLLEDKYCVSLKKGNQHPHQFTFETFTQAPGALKQFKMIRIRGGGGLHRNEYVGHTYNENYYLEK